MRTYRVFLPKNDFGTGKALGEFSKYVIYHFMKGFSFKGRTLPIEVFELKFENGYGASVIQGGGTYSNLKSNTWELAVLDSKGKICYPESITNSVIGWLKPRDLQDVLAKIEALPKRKS